MKDDMSLRFINSKSIKEFFKPYDRPFLNLMNILSPTSKKNLMNHWEISTNLRNVLLVLYDGKFFLLLTYNKWKVCLMQIYPSYF